ncbi:phosphatidylserine/phosphatidylglycerophosphate/ cardiolipin synthase [Firmicutes bacterium CAG:791]|nr:phosphatidylserine/phosphatidylglycerophosphate/ cardiolipin synthase [Firmicutes bacterium CAG:791]
MWNAIRATDKDDREFEGYFREHAEGSVDGFVQPYADSPLDEEQVGESVYMSIANGALNYLYFVTPYLILTDEMSRAITLAAERGVDVRIVTPGIPDKKITYQLTRSYYAQLVRKGVRIFEFTPGFCHAKCCVSDDFIATCGTINLDYRSLYHHFEDGCVMYGTQAVQDVKKDLDGLLERSREVTGLYRDGQQSLLIRIFRCVLRLAAPLM